MMMLYGYVVFSCFSVCWGVNPCGVMDIFMKLDGCCMTMHDMFLLCMNVIDRYDYYGCTYVLVVIYIMLIVTVDCGCDACCGLCCV